VKIIFLQINVPGWGSIGHNKKASANRRML
jgi:hypothetical protein